MMLTAVVPCPRHQVFQAPLFGNSTDQLDFDHPPGVKQVKQIRLVVGQRRLNNTRQ